MNVQIKIVSNLCKVYPEQKITAVPYSRDMVLRNEVFSFQVAYRCDVSGCEIVPEVESSLPQISWRQVDLVPVRTSGLQLDDDVERREPGLFPDVLREVVPEFPLHTVPWQWRAIWITATISPTQTPGIYPIQVRLHFRNNRIRETVNAPIFNLDVLPALLPQQRLIHTEWFHVDCLSTWYRVKVWSSEHWKIIENYLRNATAHGVNMLLTPLFTPPLDTEVGKERPTVQLVDVKVIPDGYQFNFSRLERWIELAQKCGIEYFEMSHFFTQWGAEKCPKIIAKVDGVEKRIFGWDTASTSPEYRRFLDAFLPSLVRFLKKHNLQGRAYFHISDEPHGPKHRNTYRKVASFLKRYLGGFKICDALSDFEFYRQGLVELPIPAITAIEPFAAAGMEDLWCYYCGAQAEAVSNRFLNFPSARNRVMGILLYRYGISGFLHWGFNFWYAFHSKFSLNPYEIQDADYQLPPGDAFLVYPGENGHPVDSLRYEVFSAGLQDLRALQLLETFMSRHEIERILDQFIGGRITMTDYPRGEKTMLKLRQTIYRRLKFAINKAK